jgi:biopolymer transport protein ExbD
VAKDVKATPDLITVSVTAKGDLYVNSKPVGGAGLRSALQEAKLKNPDRRIRINGDIFAPFRSIVQVLDTCQQEGLSVVGIHTADGLKK